MRLHSDLREFIELLNAHGVEYLIVGGHAVAFHGYPRYTGDIGLFLRRSSENVDRIMKMLTAFGFARDQMTESDFLEPGRIVQLGNPPNRIDLMTEISGVDFDDAWSERVSAQLDGIDVGFLSREHLLANKRASGRPKDLADLDKLERD